MKPVIEENLSVDGKWFYLSTSLAEIRGQMGANIECMRNERLDSLNNEYYADKFEDILTRLKDVQEFLYTQRAASIEVNVKK